MSDTGESDTEESIIYVSDSFDGPEGFFDERSDIDESEEFQLDIFPTAPVPEETDFVVDTMSEAKRVFLKFMSTMLCTSWRPTCETRRYRSLIRDCVSSGISRKIFWRIIDWQYSEERKRVKNIIMDHVLAGGKICLTADCWALPSERQFLIVTAHFLNKDWQLQTHLLAVVAAEKDESHDKDDNSNYVAKKLAKILKYYGCERSVVSITRGTPENHSRMILELTDEVSNTVGQMHLALDDNVSPGNNDQVSADEPLQEDTENLQTEEAFIEKMNIEQDIEKAGAETSFNDSEKQTTEVNSLKRKLEISTDDDQTTKRSRTTRYKSTADISCLVHICNLTVNEFFKTFDEAKSNDVTDGSHCITLLRDIYRDLFRPDSRERIKVLGYRLQKKKFLIREKIGVSWNTDYETIKKVIEYRQVVREFYKRRRRFSKRLHLSKADYKVLEDIQRILEPFEVVCAEIQSKPLENSTRYLQYMTSLVESLENSIKECGTMTTEHPILLKNACLAALKTMKEYQRAQSSIEALQIGLLLNPTIDRRKILEDSGLNWQSATQNLCDLVENYNGMSRRSNSREQIIADYETLIRLKRKKVDDSKTDGIQEVEQFLKISTDEFENAIDWWKHNETMFPRIAKVAQSYLAIPGSWFASKRAIFIADETISHQNKFRLGAARKLMSLRIWGKSVFFEENEDLDNNDVYIFEDDDFEEERYEADKVGEILNGPLPKRNLRKLVDLIKGQGTSNMIRIQEQRYRDASLSSFLDECKLEYGPSDGYWYKALVTD